MKNIFQNKLRKGMLSAALTASIFGAGFAVAPTPAYAIYCSNCSTFYQQMMEYVEAVNTALNTAEQLATQTRQYQNMVTQGTGLPNSMFGSVTTDLRRVASIYNRSQALGRNIANMDTAFNTQFPDYKTYAQRFVQSSGRATGVVDSTQYEKWSRQGADNAKNAMEAANMNTSTFAEEDAHLDQLVVRSQSSVGRMQAIQAGNEIAASNVQQLQKLRDLLATQVQMQGNYMAQENERTSVDDALRAQRRGGVVTNSGTNKEY
ncbi:P-type conjugative transfer protein TrbJ [Pseudomonas coleopterorum]|uniref:P-type conjugative transfer protein TrbJ n=1 Tax=Pseudomonas coleopterorum TaxID=1605838 RepID=UPI001786A98E|nr:P-type conjugative transfer protein TrbJ [Pseudomonas coleopterorum]